MFFSSSRNTCISLEQGQLISNIPIRKNDLSKYNNPYDIYHAKSSLSERDHTNTDELFSSYCSTEIRTTTAWTFVNKKQGNEYHRRTIVVRAMGAPRNCETVIMREEEKGC